MELETTIKDKTITQKNMGEAQAKIAQIENELGDTERKVREANDEMAQSKSIMKRIAGQIHEQMFKKNENEVELKEKRQRLQNLIK